MTSQQAAQQSYALNFRLHGTRLATKVAAIAHSTGYLTLYITGEPTLLARINGRWVDL
jgi:hypothetical protein